MKVVKRDSYRAAFNSRVNEQRPSLLRIKSHTLYF